MKKPFILSFSLAILIMLGGVALGSAYPVYQTAALIAFLTALSLGILFLAIHTVFAKILFKKLNNTKIAEGQSYLLKHREQAEGSAKTLLKRLKALRLSANVYTAFLIPIAVTLALSGGMLCTVFSPLTICGVLASTLLLLAVGARLPRKVSLSLDEDALTVSREDYPILFSLIDRAKTTLDVKKETVVLLAPDANASIISDKKRVYLKLGIILLHLLSENELYPILLHEFSHITDKHNRRFREKDHYTRLSASPYNDGRADRLSSFFLLFDLPYVLYYTIYQYASAILEENDADRAMIEYAEASYAASALIKLEYDNYYRFESNAIDDTPLYAAETPIPDFIKSYLNKLKAAMPTRKDDWNKMIASEILANNATHPTLNMRLCAFGIDEIEAIFEESSPAYQAELDRMLSTVDKKILDTQSEGYDDTRKKRYLDPLADVTAWENAGRPILAETYADTVEALEMLCRYQDAETLCDKAIEALPEASSHQAYFTKGCYLLYRYDEKGLDYLYRAIEANHNYLDDGLSLIGLFCCITGREKELADYRQRAVALAQKNKDEDDRANYLERGDNLSRDTMPDEMRNEIVNFILSVGENIVENIYLVRKTISDSFFTSAFIIHFYGGTDETRDEIMHKIFRYLDSYPVEWQFSLFDYFDVTAVKLDRIEGSLIWSKKNQP